MHCIKDCAKTHPGFIPFGAFHSKGMVIFMAVIKNVAASAGLSVAVVSKYLRNPDSVRLDTKERIEAAIYALNYKPSTAARALRTGRTGLLSVVMPDITNPFFAELFNSMRKEASAVGYTVLLQSTGELEQKSSVVSAAYAVSSTQRVDGVIVCFPDDESFIAELNSKMGNVPIVALGWRPMETARSSITLDVRGGIYTAAKHLISIGHKVIAYTGGPSHSVISKEKYEGYLQALLEHEIKTRPEFVYHGHFTMETGYLAAKSFLSIPEPPTAIVAENDILAVGCMKYCHKKKLSIPTQMAITGFDDISLASMYEPPITTARPPIAELGIAAVRQFSAMLGGDVRPNTPLAFSTELIIRKSTDISFSEIL